jgi:hypothetical protein
MNEYNKLLDNIDQLQELGFKSEFDIQPYLLSEDEVVKKILMSKNPNMKIEDVDLIVDSEEISIDKMQKELEEQSKKENSGDVGLSAEEKAIRKEQRKREREREKELRKEQIKQMKQLFKDKIVELKEQAKNILKEIKMAFYNLVREVKALIKKAITSLVQTGSSIGAIAVIIAAPPWNIPLAISYTMTIVDLLLTLISQLKAILPFTTSFDKLRFVTNSKNLSVLSKIINVNLEIILGLWSKLSGLDKIIQLLLDKIIQLISGDNKQKIFRKATRKLRKLGHFRNNDSYNIDGVSVRADNEDDASEAKDLLDTFKVDYGSNKVVDYKQDESSNQSSGQGSSSNPEDLLKNLKDEVGKNQNIQVPTNIQESSFYVYDVKLPNGSILRNQTEDDLEELKRIYTIVIDQIQDVTQSV